MDKIAKKASKKPARHKNKPVKADGKPKLLPGGNPQIAKACCDTPVPSCIAAMPGRKH